MRIRLQSLLLCMICLLLYISPVWGKAKLGVWPVKVFLWPDQKMGEIHLSNKGETEVNLQIYARTWDIDKDGKFVETDTGEFVFYPRLMNIQAGEEKSLRVGYNGDFPPKEKSYRLYVHELSEIKKPEKQKDKVEMGFIPLLRLSLPLFVSPTKSSPEPQFVTDDYEVADKGLKMSVKNIGTHHFTVQHIKARLFGKDNNIIAKGEFKPNIMRILPQRKVFIDIPMNTDKISESFNLGLTISLEQLKEPFEQTVSIEKINQFNVKKQAGTQK